VRWNAAEGADVAVLLAMVDPTGVMSRLIADGTSASSPCGATQAFGSPKRALLRRTRAYDSTIRGTGRGGCAVNGIRIARVNDNRVTAAHGVELNHRSRANSGARA
jgi:hypothetical protein